MSRRRESPVDAPGQDSFLDVVANLVGILIILVILIGGQTRSSALAHARAKPPAAAITPAPPAETIDVEGARRAAEEVEASIQELQARIARQNLEVALREQERQKVLALVNVAEQRLAEHRGELSDADRARYDLQRELAEERARLAELARGEQTLQEKPPPNVLPHLPTPMAKTVFGQETHFRLEGGRLAYVPWDEFVERLKADAPQKVHKLRDQPRVEESLPPLAGFAARYFLRRTEVTMQTRVGTAQQTKVELERFVLIPIEPNLGEPLARALEPGSDFRSRLAALDPQRTTITVWVYPDSFEAYRALKAELFKLRFLTAARPLPEGYPIGGSPDGVRSSAE